MANWEKVEILTDNGEKITALAPVIISASRSTDIPGCYADWFIQRLKKGYLAWINPFNNQVSYVSFEKTRIIVFWTKNPLPLIPYLEQLDNLGIHYYFQYTLNDYESEGVEPGIPTLSSRIEIFKQLSDRIGRDKVIWRYDPLFLSKSTIIETLIERIKKIGAEIHPYTRKLVISFIDISQYSKVKTALKESSIREFTEEEIIDFSVKICEVNLQWGLEIATCGESHVLHKYGISHNRCIDDQLMKKLFGSDIRLMQYLEDYGKKDKGQRESCGCIKSKDIGQYNTCSHLCLYCYANRSEIEVKNNLAKHQNSTCPESITGYLPKLKEPLLNTKKETQQTLF